MKLCAYFSDSCAKCRAGRNYRLGHLGLEHISTPNERTKRRRVDTQSVASFVSELPGKKSDQSLSANSHRADVDGLSLKAGDFDVESAASDGGVRRPTMSDRVDLRKYLADHVPTLEVAHSWPLFVISQAAKTIRHPEENSGRILSPLRDLVTSAGPRPDWTDDIFRKHVAQLMLAAMKGATYTTAFSGLDAPGVALQCLRRSCEALVGYLDDVQYMPHLCACEWHSGAMRELRAHPSKPQCLYKDIAGFLKPEYAHYDGKRLLEALQNGEDIVNLTAYCHTHCRQCQHPRGDIHVAGTPCVAWSSMGKRMKTDASDFKFFVIWAALRLKLRERLILQENVKNHDPTLLDTILGQFYERESVLTCPTHCGWATRRDRRYSLLSLKSEFAGIRSQQDHMSMEQFFRLCRRQNEMTWQSYMISPLESVVEDLAWAASQRSSCASRVRPEIGPLTLEMMCHHVLSTAEQKRLSDYVDVCGNNKPYTLTQNPHHIPICGTYSLLPTILRSSTTLWLPAVFWHDGVRLQIREDVEEGFGKMADRESTRAVIPRLMTPFEMLEAQGIPVYSNGMLWASPARSFPVSSFESSIDSRARAAVCNMAGNTMHINCVGVALAYALLCMPPQQHPDFFDDAIRPDTLTALGVTRKEVLSRLQPHSGRS